MTSFSSRMSRRSMLAKSAAAGAGGAVLLATGGASVPLPAADTRGDIRPFSFHASDADLADLKRRIKATRWPDRETVPDDSQGVQLATMQKLAAYWANDYDWRKCEARLNALPNFITEIDGLDIHFIHVKSKHPNALPVIVTHGWPGSVVEQLKIIDPLVNPTAHGGTAADAFDVVIPSMPGYGFSARPTEAGWNGPRIASAWITLMKRLGYNRFVAQGGDWGALITELLGAIAPPELLGVHTNMPSTAPPEIFERAARRRGPPAGLGATRCAPTNGSISSSRTGSPMRSRWGTARSRCTGSRIPRSASPPSSSITTC